MAAIPAKAGRKRCADIDDKKSVCWTLSLYFGHYAREQWAYAIRILIGAGE